jgi:FecCD transport family protein
MEPIRQGGGYAAERTQHHQGQGARGDSGRHHRPLLIPHFARLLVGPDFSRLLPAAMLLGAGYLIAVDTLARTIAPLEIRLGVLTAFIGAPFF